MGGTLIDHKTSTCNLKITSQGRIQSPQRRTLVCSPLRQRPPVGPLQYCNDAAVSARVTLPSSGFRSPLRQRQSPTVKEGALSPVPCLLESASQPLDMKVSSPRSLKVLSPGRPRPCAVPSPLFAQPPGQPGVPPSPWTGVRPQQGSVQDRPLSHGPSP